MRTTVRIDDDLLRELKTRAHKDGVSLCQLMNQTLRRGLVENASPRGKRRFRQKTFDMGTPLVDLTKALAVAAMLEDEEVLRKMALGK